MQNTNPLFAPILEYCETLLGRRLVEPESFRIMRKSHVIVRWDNIAYKGAAVCGLLCYIYHHHPSRFRFYKKRKGDKYLIEYDKKKVMELMCTNTVTPSEIPVANPYSLATNLFEELKEVSEILITKEKIVGKTFVCDDDDSEDEDKIVETVVWSL